MGRYIIFLLLLLAGFSNFAEGDTADGQTLIDSIVAVVSREAITRSELENEFRIAALMGTPFAEAPTAVEKRAVLEMLINRQFVLQESERLGIVIARRAVQVAEKVTEIRARYTSDAAFQGVLQQHGLENEALEAWAYEQLIYDEFFRRIFFNTVDSEEVAKLAKAYYDANKTEFRVPPTLTFKSLLIVLPKDISADEKQAAEALVQQLHARLEQGDTFAEVRETYETQLTLKVEVLTRDADTPLGVIVTELQTAQRSTPRSVPEGYQIVERIRMDPGYQKAYSEVGEQIGERIRQEQAENRFAVWLAQQKAEEIWHILDDELTRAEIKAK